MSTQLQAQTEELDVSSMLLMQTVTEQLLAQTKLEPKQETLVMQDSRLASQVPVNWRLQTAHHQLKLVMETLLLLRATTTTVLALVQQVKAALAQTVTSVQQATEVLTPATVLATTVSEPTGVETLPSSRPMD